MALIVFEDGITQGNAETFNHNFNEVNEVAISPTEPTTGEEVWIQKGKNLFNIDAIVQNKYLKQQTGELTDTENSNTSDYIPVVGGETYIISMKYDTLKLSTEREVIYFNKDKSYRSYGKYDSENKTIIVEPSFDGYIRFDYDKNCYDIQLEQGSTATSYEPYIDKKIYTKNDNGDYEEFYNEEQLLKSSIIIEKVTLPEITITSGTRTNTYKSVAKNGYIPLGIVGVDGTNDYVSMGKFLISPSNETAYVTVVNSNANSQTTAITLTVLYLKK